MCDRTVDEGWKFSGFDLDGTIFDTVHEGSKQAKYDIYIYPL
jgi:hypothetical protein